MLKKGLFSFLGAKALFFLKPELKTVFRNVIICLISIALIIYFHSEFIKWSMISGNEKYLTLSFILKNILIILSLIFLFISVKRNPNKNDGFDKFRNTELKKEIDKKLEPQKNSSPSEIDDSYFDKFRNKKKLRTTQEIKLGKK